jgi:hypothetical protein
MQKPQPLGPIAWRHSCRPQLGNLAQDFAPALGVLQTTQGIYVGPRKSVITSFVDTHYFDLRHRGARQGSPSMRTPDRVRDSSWPMAGRDICSVG